MGDVYSFEKFAYGDQNIGGSIHFMFYLCKNVAIFLKRIIMTIHEIVTTILRVYHFLY